MVGKDALRNIYHVLFMTTQPLTELNARHEGGRRPSEPTYFLSFNTYYDKGDRHSFLAEGLHM